MSSPAIDLIPIKSSTRTIQECFLSCLYIVPKFQRQYSWGPDELDDYWNDVILANGEFFFGSTVTWESESRELFNNSYSIIDGQQRLTTSVIALSVIRDFFQQIANEAETTEPNGSEEARQATVQARNTQRYLMPVDDEGVEHAVIQRSEPNFREVVLNPNAIPSGIKLNGSARQIGVARTFFEEKIREDLARKTHMEAIDALKKIRNNALKARLIQVELTTEEDGFLVFETLNTRGADLRLADLVKNLLVRGGAISDDDRNAIAGRWDRIVDRLQAVNDAASSVDQFIWQSWNSRRTAVTEAELYKKISDLVGRDASKHIDYLSELEFDSIAYQYLDDIDLIVDRKDLAQKSALRVAEVEDTLRALALFNVSVANSALLAVVRKYEKSALLSTKDLVSTCRAIENFHYQFTALLNSGSTGGTRGRYNRFAVELEEATSKAKVKSVIRSFRSKLSGSLPIAEDAAEAFADLFYAPNERLNMAQKRRSRKAFIAYTLLRMAQHNQTLPAGQSLTSWTIEHIKPQSQASNGVASPEYSIGNLTLLTGEANGDLGNEPFDGKRLGLSSWVPWKDATLATWLEDTTKTELSGEEIALRAKMLAKSAVEKVWSI